VGRGFQMRRGTRERREPRVLFPCRFAQQWKKALILFSRPGKKTEGGEGS
jgi:hypothetical protein